MASAPDLGGGWSDRELATAERKLSGIGVKYNYNNYREGETAKVIAKIHAR